MRKALFFLLALTPGLCFGCGEPSAVTVQAVRELLSERPHEVAQSFLDALNSRNQGALKATLTEKARSCFDESGGLAFRFDKAPLEQAMIGNGRVDREFADVEVDSKQNRGTQIMSIKLRKDGFEWKVYGVGFIEEQNERMVDFEEAEAQFASLQTEEQAGVATPQVLDSDQAERRARKQKRELTAQRASYNALNSISLAQHDASWQIFSSLKAASARDLLTNILERTGFQFDAGRHRQRWEQKLNLELAGLSKLEGIERICNEIGLVPVYPDQNQTPSDELPALRFYVGARDSQVAFTGPFMVEVEPLPTSNGDQRPALLLTVRALGLAPPVLAANESMIQLLGPLRVEGEEALSLLRDSEQVFFTSPERKFGLFVDRTIYELDDSAEFLKYADLVAGEVILRRPSDVFQGQFEPQSAHQGAMLELGPWHLFWDQKGRMNRFEARSDSHEYESVQVRFAPYSADGRPLAIRSQMSFSEVDYLWADMRTPAEPASLAVKVCESELLRYRFRFDGVSLGKSVAPRQEASASDQVSALIR